MTRERLWTLQALQELQPKLSLATWRRMIKRGQITPIRVGSGRGMLYITDAEVRRVYDRSEPIFEPEPIQEPPRNVDSGIIYLIEWRGIYKVGKTENLTARLCGYREQLGDGRFKVMHTYTVANRHSEEARLLALYKPYRVFGKEWFELSPQMVQEFCQTKDEPSD